jgi:hypothetical protein
MLLTRGSVGKEFPKTIELNRNQMALLSLYPMKTLVNLLLTGCQLI